MKVLLVFAAIAAVHAQKFEGGLTDCLGQRFTDEDCTHDKMGYTTCAEWIGDGSCDNGLTVTPKGKQIFLNCPLFFDDGGDCSDGKPAPCGDGIIDNDGQCQVVEDGEIVDCWGQIITDKDCKQDSMGYTTCGDWLGDGSCDGGQYVSDLGIIMNFNCKAFDYDGGDCRTVTEAPTAEPTVEPTVEPTEEPTEEPAPTPPPTEEPTEEPEFDCTSLSKKLCKKEGKKFGCRKLKGFCMPAVITECATYNKMTKTSKLKKGCLKDAPKQDANLDCYYDKDAEQCVDFDCGVFQRPPKCNPHFPKCMWSNFGGGQCVKNTVCSNIPMQTDDTRQQCLQMVNKGLNEDCRFDPHLNRCMNVSDGFECGDYENKPDCKQAGCEWDKSRAFCEG